MPYEALIDPEIVRRIDALEPALQVEVAMGISRLCESPTRHSEMALSPPYSHPAQMIRIDAETETGRHHVSLFFKFGADEQTLHIYGMGYYES